MGVSLLSAEGRGRIDSATSSASTVSFRPVRSLVHHSTTYPFTHTLNQLPIHPHTHPLAHSPTRSTAYSSTKLILNHLPKQPSSYTHTHTHTHTHTDTRTHVYTHTLTHTHTHTHTHTPHIFQRVRMHRHTNNVST